MQPSRMVNYSAMQQVELMREISTMRLAEQALRSTEPGARLRGISPIGSLAYRIANWRRLSTRRFFGEQDDLVVSPARPHGL